MNNNRLPEQSEQVRTLKEIAESIVASTKPATLQDVQDTLKDVFAETIQTMAQVEMDNHLGYEKGSHEPKSTKNRRNGYTEKTLKTSMGEVPIKTPRDREGTFEPQIVPKRQTMMHDVEDVVLSLYAKGMSMRDIAEAIQQIYGYSLSHTEVSKMTEAVMTEVKEWQNRALPSLYIVMYIDCVYVKVRSEPVAKEYAVYVIIGINVEGQKDILGFWVAESESKHTWMGIFDELKARGVRQVLFICMDGVSGLEAGARAVFPKVTVQRCMLHLLRNAVRYIPSKQRLKFSGEAKLLYASPNLEAARDALATLKANWGKYPGAINVWDRNWSHVEQLYAYGGEVRKLLYTTNAVEAVNSSLRKVTKQGVFPHVNAVLKAVYLRGKEVSKRWTKAVHNWSEVMNQIYINDEWRAIVSEFVEM